MLAPPVGWRSPSRPAWPTARDGGRLGGSSGSVCPDLALGFRKVRPVPAGLSSFLLPPLQHHLRSRPSTTRVLTPSLLFARHRSSRAVPPCSAASHIIWWQCVDYHGLEL